METNKIIIDTEAVSSQSYYIIKKKPKKATSATRQWVDRSPRIVSLMNLSPEIYNNEPKMQIPLCYMTLLSPDGRQKLANPQVAQYTDISKTGLRLVTRQAQTGLKVGSRILLEPRLSGPQQNEIKVFGRIIRQESEFIFAVQFEKNSILESHIIEQHANILNKALNKEKSRFERLFIQPIKNIFHPNNRKGLMIALTGFAIGTVVLTWVYFNSPEYFGRPLSTWGGELFPQSWHWDYVRNFRF